MEQGITPLEMMVGSKMSGEEPPLEVYSTQDKTQKKRVLTKHSSRFSLLFNVKITSQDTLYIGKSDLESKGERGIVGRVARVDPIGQ